MYPPRKNDSTSKSKNNNMGTAPSPPHKDLNKVTKLLENAKKYEQTNKRDYMLQGIMNIKKKQSDQEPLGGKNKESQLSSRGSEKQQDNKWDIYRKTGPNPGREVQRLNNYKSSENLHSNQSESYRNQGPMARESDRSSDAKIGNQLSSKQSSQSINYLNKYINSKETLGSQGIIGNVQRSSNIGTEQNYSSKYETNYNKKLEDDSPRPVSPTYSNQPQPYQSRSNYYTQPKRTQSISNNLNNNGRQIGANESKTSLGQNSSNSNTNYNTYNNSSTNHILKTQSKGSEIEKRKSPNTQIQIQEIISQNNAVRYQSQKRLTNTTNNDTQQYLKRVESGQAQQEQIKIIRKQMEKMSSQANQIRQKYYKAENQRSSFSQKCQIYQNLNNQLRKQNEKLKLQNKNYQIQLKNVHNFKQQLQNQVRELRDNKQFISLEMSKKTNELTVEMRKKTSELSKFQRLCSQLENEISKKNYQIQKLQSQNKRKQEYIKKIIQKQNEIGSLHQVNNNIEFQLKSALQKLQLLEAENKNLRQRNIEDQKYQTEKSKYRKQIQQMLEDMKDLQIQLEQKDSVINQYKNFSYKQTQNSQIKHLETQYQKLLKQKSQMGKAYEQKLLEKDKKISQLQVKGYQKTNSQGPRLGGLEAGDAAFQVILKQQLQQVNALKRELTAKVGEVFHLKIQIQNLKSQIQSQKNKFKMLSMQIQANQRNGQASSDSHFRAAKSQIQSLNRRVENMNQTIQSKRKQNQNKDEFIKRYIIGTNKEANASVLMSNLQKILNQKG